jgi:hypothetical protein
VKTSHNRFFGFLDRHLTALGVREFLLKEYELLRGFSSYGEFSKLSALLVQLGWITLEKVVENDNEYAEDEISDAINWMKRLRNENVIAKGVAATGIGRNLEILDTFDSKMDWIQIQAQRLLQHVESRRSKSLAKFTEEINASRIFIEKTDVSVFFSRYARRHLDLRFINTAFKLNEWLKADYRRTKGQDQKICFLIALAEQENSAKELLV